MTLMLMTGNSNAVKAMMSNLAFAADSADDTWIDRLSEIKLSAMQAKYEEENPGRAASEIQRMMMADYDADAQILAGQIADMNNMLKAYDSSGIHFDDAGFTEESADAYFEAHPDENQTAWARAGQLEALLKTCTYGDGTMYSFMTDKERDFLNNQGDRMELYPFLEAFSPAQRRLLSYTTMEQLFITGLLDEQGWEDTYDSFTELIESTLLTFNGEELNIDRTTPVVCFLVFLALIIGKETNLCVVQIIVVCLDREDGDRHSPWMEDV
jgi:hypothetical protein